LKLREVLDPTVSQLSPAGIFEMSIITIAMDKGYCSGDKELHNGMFFLQVKKRQS
jgi:hypothetical protein